MKQNGKFGLFICAWLGMRAIFPAAAIVGDDHQRESLPPGITVKHIAVDAEAITLAHRFDYRQLLVIGEVENGDKIDLTRSVDFSRDDGVFHISPTGVIRPIGNGQGQLTISYGDVQVNVDVAVTGFDEQHDVSFVTEVMPAISKMGCNAGTCHGAAKGKNGFQLSLRGYDPVFDHRSLTDDLASRRFNRAAPDQSLMLLKPSGVVPHVGMVLTTPGEPYYEMIRAWIADGVKLDRDAPRVASIELFPKGPIVPLPGMKQQMRVVAAYTDGKQRDVSAEAFIESGNIEVIEADEHGLLTTLRRGESPVLARYEGAYAATTLTVMGDRSGFEWPSGLPSPEGFIDTLVYDKLRRVKTLPSDVCTDAEFIRRVSLDLTGLPPSANDVRAFLADSRDTTVKRNELIDRLVGGPEFVEFWTNKWADLLQVNRKFLGQEGAWAFRNWIKQAVSVNMPYDEFAHRILTASGSNLENPPASYYKVLRQPEDIMENTTQLFLAVRFNCNKCHDHPFERWTQGQYYDLAAFFARVGMKEDPLSENRKIGGSAVDSAKPLFEVIYDKASGEVASLRTGGDALPRLPYEHADMPPDGLTRREQLAYWITSKDNPYFASSYVNRIWAYLLGVGLIEPIDDIRAGNPPTNPELLDRLTSEFISSGFDTQHMFRLICKSRTYQHSIVTNHWNEDDAVNYSHAIARRLPAEVLYDALHTVVGSEFHLPEVPDGFRAAELPDPGVSLAFLEDFGRPPRESACECERSSGVMLGPVMKLVNGPTIGEAIADSQNELAKMIAQEYDDKKIVEEIFVRILSRFPTEEETAIGVSSLASEEIVKERENLAAELADFERTLDTKQAEWEQGLDDEARKRLPDETRSILAIKAPDRSVEQRTAMAQYYRSQNERWATLAEELKQVSQLADNARLTGAQDLAWALVNSPAFLFNR